MKKEQEKKEIKDMESRRATSNTIEFTENALQQWLDNTKSVKLDYTKC